VTILVGIFVGGRGTRMGGVAKGLLPTASGSSIVERLLSVVNDAFGEQAAVALVGGASAYAAFKLRNIADDPSGIGPLGGLRALLAAGVDANVDAVITLGADMPYVDAPVLKALARYAPEARAVAPRSDGKWQPLFARFEPKTSLIAVERVLSLQQRGLYRVFVELADHACEFPLTPSQWATLRDWDSPSDLTKE
jgi:molybdopterin-guanine dinucleotide biosynthesis protein A